MKQRQPNTKRTAKNKRTTNETSVRISLNLDGTGKSDIQTGIGFFDHMLDQLAKHSLIDLKIKAQGDLQIDEHHTIEDVALTLGQALNKGLAKRQGINRYGFLLPMDETLVEVAIDLAGRPYLVFNAKFKREYVGDFPTEMMEHFFYSLAYSLGATIHINLKYGKNEHHKIEAIFKCFARALRMAIAKDPQLNNSIPSTKGIL
ncbi:MAG: imidazoleglycerol-phosphate dehydratase HisB [Patescibacteria group bacterium]|mgnify:CR=1 FL=1